MRVMLAECRSYSLPVKDRDGRTWEFVIKSWANGTENRRVYVLEQTGEYLKVITFVLPPLEVPRLYIVAVRQLSGQAVCREGAVCSAAMLLLLLAPVSSRTLGACTLDVASVMCHATAC